MPWDTIKLVPGLNVEQTLTALEAGYSAMNNGRFKAQLFQKIGGWARYYKNNITGYPRHAHSWRDLAGNSRFAAGTTTNLYDITNNTLTDISPQTLVTNSSVNFTTTANSPIVTVTDTNVNGITAYDSVFFNTPVAVDGIILSGLYPVTAYISSTKYTITAATNAVSGVTSGGTVAAFTTTASSPSVKVTLNAHGRSAGDDIVFPISTTVGGATVLGRYIVKSIVDSNNFTITASVSASSSAGPTSMNSGNVQYLYYITLGPIAAGSAYGVGTYGSGTYGFGSTVTAQSGTTVGASDWTLDNWGELLIATADGGGIYYWGPASGYSNVSIISQAPPFNTGAFVSIAVQQIIAYGSTQSSNIGEYQDPMLVKWCDVGNFFQWTDLLTNQAGQYRIPTGSRIMGGVAGPATTNYLWTDIGFWAMNYAGSQFVWGFTKISDNCGIIEKHAHAEIGSQIFWMGNNNFYMFNGSSVETMPCSVWDAVFQNIDVSNKQLCFAGSNTAFSEIMFFFPSAQKLGYCDTAAVYNIVEKTWSTVSMQRNTWIDVSVIPNPIATTDAGTVYAHESGTDADGSPISYYFETGYFCRANGEEVAFIDRIYPDAKWGEFGGSQNAALSVYVKTAKSPGGAQRIYGPFSVTQATQFITKKIRGRYIMLRIEGNDLGSFMRLGAIKVRWQSDGRGD